MLAGPRLVGGLLLGVSSLAACSGEPLSGPVDIKWDRDVCERCKMVISDRQYAAQVRDPNKKVHKFDDFGDAIFFLEHQTWPAQGIEFWVADMHSNHWLDARKAHYLGGKRTPMGYGYGALAEPSPGTVSYDEARRAILAKGK